MSVPSETQVFEWLDLEADGCLPEADRARLEIAMNENPEYRRELDRLRELRHAIEASRVEVRPEFTTRVMEALPVASWERAGRQGWGLAAAVVVALAAVSTVLLGTAGAAGGTGPVFGVVAAIGQMLQASLLTGAGLLGASWRGVGLALQEILSVSPMTSVAFGAAVVAINLLFFRLLRREVRAPQLAGRDSSDQED
jgi:anti-sigma factor RsiW